jgi:hypothetical protein
LQIESVDFTKQKVNAGCFQKATTKLTIMNCQFPSPEYLKMLIGHSEKFELVHLQDPILYQEYGKLRSKGLVKSEVKIPPFTCTIEHLILDFSESPELFNWGLDDQSWKLMDAFGQELKVNSVLLKLKINRSSYVNNVQKCLKEAYDIFGYAFDTLELSVEVNLVTDENDDTVEANKEKNAQPLVPIVSYMADHLPDLQLRRLKLSWLGANQCLEKFLSGQRRLESLEIYVLNYLDNEVKVISRALPNLLKLSVTFDKMLDVQSFNEPVSQMAKLKKLNLEATAAGFIELNIPQHLQDIRLSTFNLRSKGICEVRMSGVYVPALTKLVVKYFALRNDVLSKIFEYMPNLRHLTLFRNKHLLPVNFCARRNQQNNLTPSLANLKALEYLELDSCYINNEVLTEIKSPKLEQFVLWFPAIKGLVSHGVCRAETVTGFLFCFYLGNGHHAKWTGGHLQ